MSNLYDVVQNSTQDFVLLHASQTVQQFQELTRNWPMAVILQRTGRGIQQYFLFTRQALAEELAGKDSAQAIEEALDLAQREATPAANANQPWSTAPKKCVVLDGDQVVGFYDADLGNYYMPTMDLSKGIESYSIGDSALIPTTLNAEFPERLLKGQVVKLDLWLTHMPDLDEGLKLDLKTGDKLLVSVSTEYSLSVLGQDTAVLVTPEFGQSDRICFDIQVDDPGPEQKDNQWQGSLTATCYKGGKPIAVLAFSPTIYRNAVPGISGTETYQKNITSSVETPANLTLIIKEGTADGKPALRYKVIEKSHPDEMRSFGPRPLQVNSAAYFHSLLNDVEEMAEDFRRNALLLSNRNPDNPAEQANLANDVFTRLRGLGAALFCELFPEDLRELLWERRDQIESIFIISDDAWIPWEMIRMCSGADEGKFLCEYALSRWTGAPCNRPAVRMGETALILPGKANLKYGEQEREFVASLGAERSGIHVTRIDGTFSAVAQALQETKYTAWHFAGHGLHVPTGAAHSGILLDSRMPLYSESIAGQLTRFGERQPLIFFNACESAVGSHTLTQVGGWGSRFIAAGAAVFIGAMWSVEDESAFAFARAFYTHLLAGKTVAQAVRDARLDIKDQNNLNWLAYTVYCDPDAKLVK